MWTLDVSNIPLYEAECQKRGRAPGTVVPPSIMVHVADDPDKAWQEIAPHVVPTAQRYAAMSSDLSVSSSPWHGLDTVEGVKRSGIMQVVTPEECVSRLRNVSGPVKLHPLIGGLAPPIGWRSLELFATKVVPAINAGSAG